MAKKPADAYYNKRGSKYRVVYVTPESSPIPISERWIVLQLERVAFMDFSNPQQFITIPLTIVDSFFTGIEHLPIPK